MHIARWLTLFAALISCTFSVADSATTVSADPAIANRVRTIVAGIVSYTRWPQLQGEPRLCIFSSSTYATALASNSDNTSSPPYLPVIVHSVNEALRSQCDGIYFGTESPQQQLQLIEEYQSRPLLLIAEQNAQCTAGSAFCLNINDNTVSFSVNLDSLARSDIRVSPDVLLLAHPRNNNYE